MKKSLSILSTLFLIGLFLVAAAPVWAASTDERIQALEQELDRLKAEQQQVKQDQQQMQEDAAAARGAAPDIRYRDGRGLSIRGADRSWEWRQGLKFQTQMSFFPNSDARALQDEDDEGPSQGSMIFRHIEMPVYARLMDGLYEFGFTFRGDTNRGGQTKTERMQINFNRWSPYYPEFKINAIGPNTWAPLLRVSSSSGYSMERAPIFDGQFNTGSSKGLALEWDEVPVGDGWVNFSINYLSGNVEWDDKIARDPTDQKGVMVGIAAAPFAKTKGILKGLEAGVTYVNSHEEEHRGSSLGVATRGRNNEVDIFTADINGRRTYISNYVEWEHGPYSLSFAHDYTKADKENLDGAGLDQSDVKLRTLAFGGGAYVWGPDGFMSGSRNGGWRFTYTHARSHFDQGNNPGTTDFDMRDWNYIENIFMLRWFQKSNLSYALEYQVNHLNQMRGGEGVNPESGGGNDAAIARKRLGVSADGGTYQIITLNAVWTF